MAMQKQWYEICLAVRADDVEAVAASLIEAGFEGLEERPQADGQWILVVFAECQTSDEVAMARDRAVAAANRVAQGPSNVPALTTLLDPAVWTENWRRHFVPLRVGEKLLVLPPWEEVTDHQRILVVINPGIAFGTGHHETTEGCLAFLDEKIRPGMRIADVGCGSGILAIAAIKLGAKEAIATDNDPDALVATKENIEANGVRGSIEVAAELPAPPPAGDGSFDLVVANILAETLVELRAMLEAAVAQGGSLILSGIEKSRRKLVEDAFFPGGWQLERAIEAGDWVTLALHRRSES